MFCYCTLFVDVGYRWYAVLHIYGSVNTCRCKFFREKALIEMVSIITDFKITEGAETGEKFEAIFL